MLLVLKGDKYNTGVPPHDKPLLMLVEMDDKECETPLLWTVGGWGGGDASIPTFRFENIFGKRSSFRFENTFGEGFFVFSF